MAPARSRLLYHPGVWTTFLILGCCALAAYFLVPSSVGKALLYDGLNLAAVAAILARLARQSPRSRAHWGFIAGGALLSLAGNVTWDIYELLLHEPPFPSLADVFYLGQYPLLATGFLLMVRARTQGGDRIALLDSLIAASGAAALAWVFLVVPITEDAALGLLGQIFAGAYPLMDVVLLATMVRLVAVPGKRSTSYVLLMVSLLSLIVGDAVFGVIAPLGLYETGSLLDMTWLFFFVALGAAALHPSARTVAEPRLAAARSRPRKRRLLVLVAALLGPGALVIQHLTDRSSLAVILVGSGTIVVLILVRIAEQQRTEDELRRALWDVTKLSEEREALVARLVTVQEEERKLIAREIHDDSIQKMIALKMRIDLMRRAQPDLAAIKDFQKLSETADRSVKSLRHLMFGLRPYHLDSDGLAAALRLYLDEQMTLPETPALELDDRLRTEPPEEPRTVLYRIAQEAVTNARKHARASRIKVALEDERAGHTLRVIDDGVGFESIPDSAPGHLGLTSMRERAEMVGGHLTVESRPGRGTTLSAWVPRGETRHSAGSESTEELPPLGRKESGQV